MPQIAKVLPVARLATHKLLVPVDGVVGLELLAATLAGKHIATLLPNLVLVRRWQTLESLVPDNTGVTLSLSCAVYFCAQPASSGSQTSGYSTCSYHPATT